MAAADAPRGRAEPANAPVALVLGLLLAAAPALGQPAPPEAPDAPGPAAVEREATAPVSPVADASPPAEGPVDSWMEEQVRAAEETLASAHFRSARGIARQLRGRASASTPQRIRLELVVATASLALGDTAEARASLRRILVIDPGFAVPATAAPKLRRALDLARAAGR